jgi:hypothetical protein
MDSTQGARGEAWLAATVAVLSTTAMFWGLSRMMRPIVAPAVVDAPLQVVWIARKPVPPHDESSATTQAVAAATASRPLPRTRAKPDPPSAAVREPEPARPLSAVYLMQARDATATDPARPPDPLADRQVQLPGAGSERFRMRRQASVATVVSGIGRLFGARDPDEPCREHRRNIGDLALDGDSAALQQQIDYERRRCRP